MSGDQTVTINSSRAMHANGSLPKTSLDTYKLIHGTLEAVECIDPSFPSILVWISHSNLIWLNKTLFEAISFCLIVNL